MPTAIESATFLQDRMLHWIRTSQDALLAALEPWRGTARDAMPEPLRAFTMPFADALPTVDQWVDTLFAMSEMTLAFQRDLAHNLLACLPAPDKST